MFQNQRVHGPLKTRERAGAVVKTRRDFAGTRRAEGKRQREGRHLAIKKVGGELALSTISPPPGTGSMAGAGFRVARPQRETDQLVNHFDFVLVHVKLNAAGHARHLNLNAAVLAAVDDVARQPLQFPATDYNARTRNF